MAFLETPTLRCSPNTLLWPHWTPPHPQPHLPNALHCTALRNCTALRMLHITPIIALCCVEHICIGCFTGHSIALSCFVRKSLGTKVEYAAIVSLSSPTPWIIPLSPPDRFYRVFPQKPAAAHKCLAQAGAYLSLSVGRNITLDWMVSSLCS